MSPEELWHFLPRGYLITVAIETPVLLLLLVRHHTLHVRLFAGFWLTACTYPIVVLVLPLLMDIAGRRWLYLLAAETFAPAAECVLFWLAFQRGRATVPADRFRDYTAIILANLASFGLVEAIRTLRWINL